MNRFKKEVVVTQSYITLYNTDGTSWTIGKKHFSTIRTAINKSNNLRQRDKHNVIKIPMSD